MSMMGVLASIDSACAAENRWAVLVGIDQYQRSEISPLRGAVKDVIAISDALLKRARFSRDNVLTLTNDDQANLPDLGNIIIKLKYMADKIKPKDDFLF